MNVLQTIGTSLRGPTVLALMLMLLNACADRPQNSAPVTARPNYTPEQLECVADFLGDFNPTVAVTVDPCVADALVDWTVMIGL
jgi:hypothetical protein